MRNSASILTLVVILAIALSCRLTESLTGDPKGGMVSALWPDVPPYPGATKADMELPLSTRLIIRAAMQGKINFIAFTSGETAQHVQDFYSIDRMKTAGWIPHEKGCIGDTEDQQSHGAICLFERRDVARREGLAIIMAQDEKTKQTNIFYARIDLN
jgi:hypothetical protein